MSVKSILRPEKWNSAAELLLLIYIAECTVGSSGRWLEIGPLSIRMILFGLCFAATLPAVFRSIGKLARNLQIVTTVVFGVYYILISAFLGLIWNNPVNFVWADVTSMMSLALFPGFMVTMCNRRAISRAIDVVFWSATALSLVTVLLHFVLAFVSDETIRSINIWINDRSLGGLALMKTGIQRIFMKSQMFLQVAVVYGVWKIGKSSGKRRAAMYISEGIMLSACILSYTRGFWLGLAVSAALLLLMGVRYWTRFLKVAGCMIAVFAVFIAISSLCYRGPAAAVEIVHRLDPDLLVTDSGKDPPATPPEPGSDTDSVTQSNMTAVAVREKTLALLKVRIGENPIFGKGLGENLDDIRSDGKTEYMYLDIMMKSGLIGTVLFAATFFGFIIVQICYSFQRKKQKLGPPEWEEPEIRNRFLTAAYLGVAVTSFVNPFLINPMGITLLMITATAVYDGKINKCEV